MKLSPLMLNVTKWTRCHSHQYTTNRDNARSEEGIYINELERRGEGPIEVQLKG